MSESNQYQTPSSRVDAQSEQAYSDVKVFSPKGRMGRVRFINYYIVIPFAILLALLIVIGIVGAVLVPIMGESAGGIISVVGGLIMLVIYIAFIIYAFIVIIQRCHDFNASGWLSLVMLIPVVGFLFLIALLVIPGTEGENNFGAPTKPNSTAGVVFAILAPFFLIVVIGILAAISIPAYQGYIEKVNQAKQFEQQQFEQQR